MNDTIWLTQEAYEQLRKEYDYISGEGRDIISAKIAQAREEGDLSENAGYHAAREEQGQNELKVRRLKAILDSAEVGAAGEVNDEVRPGATITIAFDGDPDDMDTFLLGARELLSMDDSVEVSVYSPQSPIGAAILGCKVGDEVSYVAPNGRQISVTIIAIEGFLA